jgi:Fe-S-cluster containining protein
MRFRPIPARYFAEFHRTFQGDTSATFMVCDKCGGACEFNKIGTLMPGEREYMARKIGLSASEFSRRNLDVLVMEDGTELDVLRLINGCPFLKSGRCTCREYKVVLCDIYPIGFHVRDGQVEFEVDDWCPLADTLRFRAHFLDRAIAAVSRLPVPIEWYHHVERFDHLNFDYLALEAYRRDRSLPQTFTLDELLRFQRPGKEAGPKERFHPFPSEVVVRGRWSGLRPEVEDPLTTTTAPDPRG